MSISNQIEIKIKECEEFKTLIKDKDLDVWVHNGVYYGYPKCCIIDFCTRGYDISPVQEAVHGGHGFVPCPKCALDILKGKATLESLIKNRFCETNFPIDF